MNEIPEEGKSAGHKLEWDPPHALSSARRWTCGECYATLLDYEGHVYGSATERTCAEETAYWGQP